MSVLFGGGSVAVRIMQEGSKWESSDDVNA